MREDVIRSRNCSISGFLRAQIEKCSIVKTKTNKENKYKTDKYGYPENSKKIVTDLRIQLFCRKMYKELN